MAYVVPPACSGSALRSPSSWTCPEHPQRKAPRRHSDQTPQRSSSSTPSSLRMSSLQSSLPKEETNFGCLYLRSHSLTTQFSRPQMDQKCSYTYNISFLPHSVKRAPYISHTRPLKLHFQYTQGKVYRYITEINLHVNCCHSSDV